MRFIFSGVSSDLRRRSASARHSSVRYWSGDMGSPFGPGSSFRDRPGSGRLVPDELDGARATLGIAPGPNERVGLRLELDLDPGLEPRFIRVAVLEAQLVVLANDVQELVLGLVFVEEDEHP